MSDAIFQAVGIIRGDVKIAAERDKAMSITIKGKEYPLLYIPSKQGYKALEALKKEVAATGANQRLIVYPKITHFPGRDEPYILKFQLVGFDRNQSSQSGLTSDLCDFEFKLSGLWQFIPACKTPCISVFKNFTETRLEYVKKIEVPQRVKFMKGSHLPIIWRNPPVNPFRFNPKAEKENQGKPLFVSVKARLIVEREVFAFTSVTDLPTEEVPKFFKATKKMKSEAKLDAPKKEKKLAPEKQQVASPISKTVHRDFQPPKLKKPACVTQ